MTSQNRQACITLPPSIVERISKVVNLEEIASMSLKERKEAAEKVKLSLGERLLLFQSVVKSAIIGGYYIMPYSGYAKQASKEKEGKDDYTN